MKKRIVAITLALILALSFSIAIYADPGDDPMFIETSITIFASLGDDSMFIETSMPISTFN